MAKTRLSTVVRANLDKCRWSALAAVEGYNKPGPRFRTAQYIVWINMAWCALFHAIFYKRSIRPWYKSDYNGKTFRYVKIDNEPKHWDLAQCLAQYYQGNHPPERRNLEFLLGLRNKIEHRNLPALDATLYGECQAALQNLEDLIVQEFGAKCALGEQLAVSLQFSRTTPETKQKALKALASNTAKKVKEYIECFRAGLPGPILDSLKYSYTVYLIPRTATRPSVADAAIEFVKYDDLDAEQQAQLERLNVTIKEKHVPIVNLQHYKPGEVVKQLCKRLNYLVDLHVHTRAWQYFGVRPQAKDDHPERTKTEYCLYDQTHEDYVYTKAWIEKLATALSDPTEYEKIVGKVPKTLKMAA